MSPAGVEDKCIEEEEKADSRSGDEVPGKLDALTAELL